ncbi:MAG: nucleoside triphosphate pyrophosphohydrolase [Gammaproteobacteria bacterium]|nr:MAG: nucleoside triphosphate pyrophosphohydrolase [Gammaproteobacteria bacterium]
MAVEHSIERLLEIMAQLRDPQQGCPWDRNQNFESITPHTIEEAYEVADCIERRDSVQLKDELGDLLFQVIFYSQLAQEEGSFEFNDVVENLNSKLLRRHPHGFDSGKSDHDGPGEVTEQAVRLNWEKIKQHEKQSLAGTEKFSQMDDVPRNLPALSRAQKLQKRAANVGFDWPSITPALAKISEETEELKQALSNNDPDNALEEVGDLMFSCVNVVRHLNADSEQLLRRANDKFEQRFRKVEQLLDKEGVQWQDSDLEHLDQLWELAKQRE